MTDRIAGATRLYWRNRCVWIPPTGNPYFVDRNPAQDMTEEQLAEFWNDMQVEDKSHA